MERSFQWIFHTRPRITDENQKWSAKTRGPETETTDTSGLANQRRIRVKKEIQNECVCVCPKNNHADNAAEEALAEPSLVKPTNIIPVSQPKQTHHRCGLGWRDRISMQMSVFLIGEWRRPNERVYLCEGANLLSQTHWTFRCSDHSVCVFADDDDE